jgi:hypothetical protein
MKTRWLTVLLLAVPLLLLPIVAFLSATALLPLSLSHPAFAGESSGSPNLVGFVVLFAFLTVVGKIGVGIWNSYRTQSNR